MCYFDMGVAEALIKLKQREPQQQAQLPRRTGAEAARGAIGRERVSAALQPTTRVCQRAVTPLAESAKKERKVSLLREIECV